MSGEILSGNTGRILAVTSGRWMEEPEVSRETPGFVSDDLLLSL